MAQVYADERWGRPFGFLDPIYATGWHRGQDIRKQNAAKTASVSHEVLALADGKVHSIVRMTKIGNTVVIDTGRAKGRFEFHSHLMNIKVKMGQPIKRGQSLAWTATTKAVGGTSWGGPHDHIVISDYADGSWQTGRKVYDPRPFIRLARIQGAATGTPTPTKPVVPTTPKPTTPEEDMPLSNDDINNIVKALNGQFNPSVFRIVNIPGRTADNKVINHKYLSGPGGVKHISGSTDLELLRRWMNATPTKEETFRSGELIRINSYLTGLGQYVAIPDGK